MGWRSRLFGASDGWASSENGNPTLVKGNQRLTVFPQDGGFKFCVAFADRDDDDPYFSDPYRTGVQAKDAALSYLAGRISPYATFTKNWQEQRTIHARQHLGDTVTRLSGLARDAIDAKTVTALRKVEAKVTLSIKVMRRAGDGALHDGLLSSADIAKAETLPALAERLLSAVQNRITELGAR